MATAAIPARWSALPTDNTALAPALEAYRPALRRYLAPRTRNHDDCEDLLQDVLLSAARALPRFRNTGALARWLRCIAANHLKNYYRHVIPHYSRAQSLDYGEQEQEKLVLPDNRPASSLHCAEQRLLVRQMLAAASAVCTPQEQAVLWSIYAGESIAEMERKLGERPATLRTRFLRARSKLLAALFQQQSDLLGGPGAIAQGQAAAQRAVNPHYRLTAEELQAFYSPCPRVEIYRAACLKIARCLPLREILPAP